MRHAALLLSAMLLVAPAARAAGSEDDVKRATAAYAEGMDLRVAGKLDASLERLLLAHRTFPTSITGLELGRGYMLVGRLIEARETLLSVARVGPRAGESARANSARAEAAGLAAALGERTPRIVFEHAGAAPAVTVDGAAVASVDVPLALNPGTHTVAWAGASRTVTLTEGQAVTISLTPPVSPRPPPPVMTSDGGRDTRGPFWVALGLTGAAAGVGTVAGIVAIGKADTARPGCPGGQCQPSAHGAADEAKTWSTVSTVSFVAAGVFGAATIVAFVLSHGASKEPPQVGSVSLSF
jgi:hypothetical protein